MGKKKGKSMGRTKSFTSLDTCNDRVYRLVNTPIYTAYNDRGYKTLLVQTSDDDLEEALEILRIENAQVKKQEEIKTELEIRRKPERVLKNDAWEEKFSKRWENMRKAAKMRRYR